MRNQCVLVLFTELNKQRPNRETEKVVWNLYERENIILWIVFLVVG